MDDIRYCPNCDYPLLVKEGIIVEVDTQVKLDVCPNCLQKIILDEDEEVIVI